MKTCKANGRSELNDKDIEKVLNFLREYQDLYGNNLFVDRERIESIAGEFPDLPGEPNTKPSKPVAKVREKKMTKPADSPLWNFKRKIENCKNCALGNTRTKFVFGSGSEHADIMFIGEAPGAEEDRTGIPFVGRAGKLLDRLLAQIQLKRDDIFIANILKCRPPNNRDPLPDEVAQCIPYLHRQIELIQPKVIVALGRIAAQNLLRSTASLKQMRGRLWQYRGVDMIVTYHPAAILRNAGLLTVATEDFKFIRETYREILKRQN